MSHFALYTGALALLTLLSACTPLQQGSQAHREGDLSTARSTYEASLKVNPNDVLTRNNLGLVLMQQGQYRDALAQFNLAVAIDPNQPLLQANVRQAYTRVAAQASDPNLQAEARAWLANGERSVAIAQAAPVPTPQPIQRVVPTPTPVPLQTPQPVMPTPTATPTAATVPTGLTPEQIQTLVDQRVQAALAQQKPAAPAGTDFVKPAPITGQKFAVVIGISQYQTADGYKPLPSAAQDARKMYQYLTTKGGFKPDQTKLLLDDQATVDNIRRQLKQFLLNSANSPDDIVFIYYSGHGDLLNRTDAYIVPYGVRRQDLPISGLPLDELHRDINRLKSQKVALLIDACNSGGILQGVNTKGELQDKRNIADNFLNMATQGRLIMTSSAEDETSLEVEGKGGLFTHYLLKGLQGEADMNQDKAITVAELYAYVRRNVEREAREKTGAPQSVQKNGELEGVIADLGGR